VSEDALEKELAQQLSQIHGGQHTLPKVISITIAAQTEDLSPEARAAFLAMLQRLFERNVFTKGAAATERGKQNNNLHLQIMCKGDVVPDKELLQKVLGSLLKDPKHVPELRGVQVPPRGFHIVVKLHDEGGGEVTFERMLGCAPHACFIIPYFTLHPTCCSHRFPLPCMHVSLSLATPHLRQLHHTGFSL
jgi:hypothetical protein